MGAVEESPFAQISKSEHIVFNRSAFAVWDQFPVTPGHALVIPHRLIGSWWQASEEERADLFELVNDVRVVIEQEHEPDGFNLGINVGEAAGQTIDHLHIHVIPRYKNDVSDPRGGVRHVIPSKGNYLREIDETLPHTKTEDVPTPKVPMGPPAHRPDLPVSDRWGTIPYGADKPDSEQLNRMMVEIAAGFEYGDPRSRLPQSDTFELTWRRIAAQMAKMEADGVFLEFPD